MTTHDDTNTAATGGQTNASFSSLIQDEKILASLTSHGFQSPTPLQTTAIPALTDGGDVVVIGARNSGKSISYSVHLAHLFPNGTNAIRKSALVIANTSVHVKAIVDRLASFGVPVTVVDGSQGELKAGAIFVGTPDSIWPAVESGAIAPSSVGWVILDEVGDLLSPQTLTMLESTLALVQRESKKVQFAIFGKAISNSLAGLIKNSFRDPQTLGVTAERGDSSGATHSYFELGGDLMAKTNLLADLIGHHGGSSIVIYCNSPSDSDFVEVMLRKRSVEARKLVGNVPSFKVQQALEDLKGGSVRALIVTDISAKSIEIEDLDILVNYSIPSDPEIYIHRLGRSGTGGAKHLIISLVGPLDVANFHYLKKFVEFEFVAGEAPPREDPTISLIRGIEQRATQAASTLDADSVALVPAILESAHRDAIIAMLVANHMNPPASRGNDRRDRRSDDGQQGGERRGRDRRRGGRDDYSQSADGQGPDGRDQTGGERAEGGDSYRQRDEAPRREYIPPIRFTRLYIGRGSRDGLSEQQFRELATTEGGLTAEQVKRVFLRSRYAFADVPEELADGVITKLNAHELPKVGSLLVMKATSISEPRGPESLGTSGTSAGEGQAGKASSENADGSRSDSESSEFVAQV